MRAACRIANVLLVLSLFVSPASILYAQTGSMRVTVPSPTAASLGKFGDVPVNLYTGIPDISIPLFTVQGRTLELPIVLRYHAGGIRVEEIGGWAGLGWSLEAGGVITRTVRGLVDEGLGGYYHTGHVFYDNGNWPNASLVTVQNIANRNLDGEPDRFFFSFAGRSGQFVFGPTTTSQTVRYRSIPHQKLRIEPGFSGDAIQTWTITAEDGTRYRFTAAEATTDLGQISISPGVSPISPHYGQVHTSSWHLTQIRSPGGDEINFFYSPYSVRHRSSRFQERFDYRISNFGSCVPDLYDLLNEYQISVQRLDSIKSAVHTVRFTTALRDDARSPSGAAQEHRLVRITVETPSGVQLRRFQFEHDYGGGGRLRLRSVQEQDRQGAPLPAHTFTYYDGTLPPRTSFAQDHWGFFNGVTSNNTFIPATVGPGGPLSGANRSPDPVSIRVGALRRITYPTGGFHEFDFEANAYGAIGTSDELPMGEGPLQSAQTFADAGVSEGSTQFTIGGTSQATVRVTVYKDPSGCENWFDPPCPIAEIVGMGDFTAGTHTLMLNPGTYILRARENGSGGLVSISVEWRDRGPVKMKTASGLRVAEVRTGDAMGNVSRRGYVYTLQSDAERSSGVINHEPAYTYSYNSSQCSFFSRSSMSKVPLGEGPILGYREVWVWHGANGEHGRTRHTFRTVRDAPDEQISSWPYAPPTSYEYRRGQQTGAAEYNAAGQIQRQTASTHRFRETQADSLVRFRGLTINEFTAGQYGSLYMAHPFEIVSAWSHPEVETTTFYNEVGSSPFSAGTTYSYGNPAHLQLTQLTETNSDGKQRITRMKYPADYASGSSNAEATAITAMKGSAHIHSAVIERWMSDKVGTTERVVSAEVTSFRANASRYLPYQRFVFNATSSVTNFAPSTVSGSFVKDSRYLLQETANTYDAFGRMTQLANARGKLTNYVYGGNPNNAFLTRVTRVRDATGSIDLVTDLTYDADGNLASINDEGSTLRRFTYDSFGRLRQIRNHANTATLRAFGYTYSRTVGNGWTFQPGSPNLVLDTIYRQHSPSVERIVSRQYLDGLGRPVQGMLQDGSSYHVSAQQYDAMGREWRTWKPYTRTSAAYDASFASNATSFYNTYLGASNAKPYVESQYTPDALSRPKRGIPEFTGTSATAFTMYNYGNHSGNKWTITDATDESGKTRRTYFDAFGNEVRIILGYGATEATTTNLAYNVLGQRTQLTDPRGLVTTYTWNTRGLLTARSSPDAGSTQQKYDRAGNLRYTQYANQTAAGQVEFTTYDFANRPLLVGRGTATFSSLDPDAASAPALETSQGNWVVVRKYDTKPTNVFPWSQFWTQISPLTLANVSGRLAAVATKSNGAWQVELYSYDADGRVASRSTFTQNNAGSAVLTALNTTTTYTRDLRDEITRRVLTVGSSSFYQWYDYEARGLLWKVTGATSSTKPSTADVTYSYRPSGQLASRRFGSGVTVPFRYTIREQLERIGDPATTTYPFSARYAYHPNGTISQAEFYSAGSPAANKRYRYVFGTASYDALNRLRSADYSHWSGSAWTSTLAHDLTGITYDAAGNLRTLQRYRETGTLIDNLTYSYPTGSNRLSSVTDAVTGNAETWDAKTGSFTYDASGNLLSAPAPYSITATTYGYRHLPVRVTNGGVTTNYRYDHNGQRFSKQTGSGNTRYYILDGATTLAQFTLDGAGNVASSSFRFVAGDLVVGRFSGTSSRRYFHTDLLGSTRAVILGTSNQVESYDYDPWGVLMPGRTLGSGTLEGFTGKERDVETGLDYFGARYYMPALGRWKTVDPPADSFPSWNPYNYVFNNPAALTDPDGRCPICLVAYGVFEVGATIYDVGDLTVTGYRYLRGRASGLELSVTAAGAAAGVVGFGGGMGRAGRAALRAGDWAPTTFRAGELDKHFTKHAAEWGAGNITKGGYLTRARQVLSSDIGGNVHGFTRANGDVVRYNARTNEFAVAAKDGTIRTLFRPQEGMEYYLREATR